MANGMDSCASPFLTNEVDKLMKSLNALNESSRLPYIIFSLTLRSLGVRSPSPRSLHEISCSTREQEISPCKIPFTYTTNFFWNWFGLLELNPSFLNQDWTSTFEVRLGFLEHGTG
jgi:hypothetical protein